MSAADARRLFAELIEKDEATLDLATASLLIAKEEYPDLSIDAYVKRLDWMAEQVESSWTVADSPLHFIRALNRYLFDEEGFTGNTWEYYDPRNSFLNDVLDRKTGIPITLSVVYMEVGRRLGLPLVGVGLPAHFVVKYQAPDEEILIDPFHRGAILSEEHCRRLVEELRGGTIRFRRGFLEPVTKRQILTRMLNNLKNIYIKAGEYQKALSVVERILLLNPGSLQETRDRGLLYARVKRYAKALSDLQAYLNAFPKAPDAPSIRQQILSIRQAIALLN
ncbi:MAG: tetratricopeptide repeat protein [candidate division NC10 bacterium]|nr:tetratricopeptide repeat protein [candidate division NC10 bacterium]